MSKSCKKWAFTKVSFLSGTGTGKSETFVGGKSKMEGGSRSCTRLLLDSTKTDLRVGVLGDFLSDCDEGLLGQSLVEGEGVDAVLSLVLIDRGADLKKFVS